MTNTYFCSLEALPSYYIDQGTLLSIKLSSQSNYKKVMSSQSHQMFFPSFGYSLPKLVGPNHSQPDCLLRLAHTWECVCMRMSAVTRCSYNMILTAQCKHFNFLFKMLAFASIWSHPSKFSRSAHPCRDPKSTTFQ